MPNRDTKQGFRDPDRPEREAAESARAGSPASPLAAEGELGVAPRKLSRAPGAGSIDVDVRRESGEPGLLEDAWIAVELWTQNRIYGLAADLVCLKVRNRSDGALNHAHASIGARLVGGQRRGKTGLITEVSYPYPEVGGAAVFATGLGNRLRVSETSTVTRVVVRQRVVTLGPGGELPSWDEITSPRIVPR